MSEEPVAAGATTRGYLSEASKRRFTITAGILGTVFLIAQFVLPFALMVGMMASSSRAFDVDFARRNPYRAAIWDGGFWFIETEAKFGDDPDPSTLVRTDIDDTSNPETMVSIFEGTPYLLAGEDRLWLISKKTFAYFQDGQHVAIDQPEMLAEFSIPFLLEGRPAVLERWPSELALVVHDGVFWQPRATLPIVLPDPDCGCGLDWAKAVADERGVHVFVEFGDTVYYGLWNPASDDGIDWELASEAGRDWSPVLWRGEPAVLGVTSRDDSSRLVGTQRSGNGWSEFLRLDRQNGELVSALNLPESDSLVVLVGSSYSSSVKVLEIDGSSVVRESWIGEQPEDFEQIPSMMAAIMSVQYGATLLFPLILAVILSTMMRRHRVVAYSSGARSVQHASLTRRALAQLVDIAIAAGPVIFTVGLFMRRAWSDQVDEPDGFWEAVVAGAPIIAAIGWAFLAGLVFTISEGRWGITPGKWLTKIKVLGTDLRPCGFGRALVRNLLKCIDGFFNFVVGIMVVALSENWQRVGDMAARTVVVDAKSRPTVPDQ